MLGKGARAPLPLGRVALTNSNPITPMRRTGTNHLRRGVGRRDLVGGTPAGGMTRTADSFSPLLIWFLFTTQLWAYLSRLTTPSAIPVVPEGLPTALIRYMVRHNETERLLFCVLLYRAFGPGRGCALEDAKHQPTARSRKRLRVSAFLRPPGTGENHEHLSQAGTEESPPS